ncbi:helix-turn-helix transcriptional regulator [Kozakia baliensis]|uniref:helix-turn-helix transcriptional regulator n=1 Tax=Kozakia baliensis TaxID=153496 RepID=UPI00049607D3|nr:hypothetical protein [Kozakia baliensis]
MGEVMPRCLKITDAAKYLGISEASFRATVGKVVPPIYMSPQRPVWLRDQLDRWVNEKAGIVTPGIEQDELMDAITRR